MGSSLWDDSCMHLMIYDVRAVSRELRLVCRPSLCQGVHMQPQSACMRPCVEMTNMCF